MGKSKLKNIGKEMTALRNLRKDSYHNTTQKQTILDVINKIWKVNNLDKYFPTKSILSDDQQLINDILKHNSIMYYVNGGKFEPENIYEHWNKSLRSIAIKKDNNVAVLVNFGRINKEISRYKKEKWDYTHLKNTYSIYEKIKNHGGLQVLKNNLITNILVIDISNTTLISDLYEMENKIGWFPNERHNQFEKDIFDIFISVTKHHSQFTKFWNDHIKQLINLNVCDIIGFFDLWVSSLTKVGKEIKDEIKKHFVETYFNKEGDSFINEVIESCYINRTAQCGPQEYFSKLVSLKMRQSENDVREILGISKIGEGNVSETKLYYQIKTKLPQYEVIHQGNPKWLGRQRLDIYIPELNVGIEYQGGQHFDPNHYHNTHNPDSFEKNKERDERKRLKCESNGCKLVYVYEGVDYNINDVINEILIK